MAAYGARELRYAAPIADALAGDDDFRRWLLGRTPFAALVGAHVLVDEMRARRSRAAKYWWRSHYTESCRCDGCRGQETDLLAIMETAAGFRFALHLEVKNPNDRFRSGGRQAESYPRRAECWVGKPPKSVVPHEGATTLLACSAASLAEFATALRFFDAVVTFEEIERLFPTVATWRRPAEALPRADVG